MAPSEEDLTAVSYPNAPTSVRSLEQRMRNMEGNDELALRRRVSMALVVVGQMFSGGCDHRRKCDGAALRTPHAVHTGPRRLANPITRMIP